MSEGKGKNMRGGGRPRKERPEFDQTIIDLSRVTRVTKGGKQLSFRACVVLGDRKGRVGFGLDKGKDVQLAVEKAVNQAKKNMITVPMVNETIPHRVEAKFKAGRVMVKPAPRGSGIIAGSAVRVVLELAGVPNASTKIMGKTKNKVTNVKAIFEALQSFKKTTYRVQKTKTTSVAPSIVAAPQEEVAAPVAKTAPKKRAPKAEAAK